MANKDMIVRIQADTKNYDANLAKASRTLNQFAKDNLTMGGVLKQASSAFAGMATSVIGVTAAIGAAKKVLGDMVSINRQFEQSSSNLAAVMGKTRDEITGLTDQAKQLGATTQYTANQILELQANLARLGFNETEILNSTKAVQGMATAMGADLGEAANLAGSALRGFGLNATEMERVASVLSVGTTKSALSFEKLATALPIVQTSAAKTGFTIEDTVAMLGKLTDNGINAASAATQLRKILNDSTTAGTKLANALGGPVKSFDELVVALDKASKAGQTHADSVTLVNSKNATALDILRDMATQREVEVNGVKTQTSALQELRDSITDCSDGMRAMQDEQLNTLQGSITILNSAWEGLMLTFSESNGAIKAVTDSLTSLLTAWTKWRNRNAGGDSAIKSYQLYGNGLDNEAKQNVQEIVKGYKAGGSSDEQIVAQFTKEKEAIEKERDAARQLYDQLAELDKLKGKQHDVAQTEWNKQFAEMFKNEKYGYNLQTDGAAPDYILRQIAKMEDDIAKKDYGVSLLTAPEPGKKTAGEEGQDQEDKTKGFLAKRRAQIEAGMQKEIADLDKANMIKEGKEAEYEERVYQIKRAALEQIAKLYQEDTTERAKAEAAISSLDIQYQGTQMRLANRGSKSTKTYETQTGPSGYSQEGISALRSEIQSGQKSMQMGSDEYMFQAERLVDLTAFENLLKTATANGIQIDPAMLEGLFEQIDNATFSDNALELVPSVSDEAWQTLVDTINEKLADLGLDPIKLDVKTGSIENAEKDMDKLKTNVEGAIGVFGQLGGAMQQLEDPGAQVAGIIMQAIASVAGSFAKSLMGAVGPWDWIAAAIGGVSTMISTIAAIKSATKGYAGGGMVEGTSYSGDNIVARLNAGEGVLTQTGVRTAAAMADGMAGSQRVMVEGRISGKDILLSANNTNRAAGGSRGYYTKVK